MLVITVATDDKTDIYQLVKLNPELMITKKLSLKIKQESLVCVVGTGNL